MKTISLTLFLALINRFGFDQMKEVFKGYITKGHGGSIECESVEGEGTEFVVKLPIL